MALNKFMHPRNIYKTPPNFAKLAKNYEEFSKVAKVDVTGKVSIDFKNPHSLRVLTKYLLKSDFNVDIEIPEDRLVPTLPLRLNYILWIEDLLNSVHRNESVVGLDIGTGACAIYPILAAVKSNWNMIGTESDKESLKKATENVQRNNLQNLIELKMNETSTIIDFLLQSEDKQIFHFCMCNPPFYSNIQDLWESRSPARPPPKNGFTGSPQELITEGGELQFCRQILEESKLHKNKILFFTTMVGHKYNLKELVLDLQTEKINYTTTEFCQGRVTRWGLAWTYLDYDISKLVPSRDKLHKKNTPITVIFQKVSERDNEVQIIAEKLKCLLQELNITHKMITKRNNEISLDIMAPTNTWSNQRRKRRLMKRMQEDEVKKQKLSVDIEKSNMSSTEKSNMPSTEKSNMPSTSISLIDASNNNGIDINTLKLGNESNGSAGYITSFKKPLVHAVAKIGLRENNIILEMEFIDGIAGKEGLHQIVQYIKNKWT